MRTMQQKTLGHIAQLITDAGFEPVQSTSAANIGTITIQQQGAAVVTYGELHYDFQRDRMNFTIEIEGFRLLSQPPRVGYHEFLVVHTNRLSYERFHIALAEALTALAEKYPTDAGLTDEEYTAAVRQIRSLVEDDAIDMLTAVMDRQSLRDLAADNAAAQ